MGSPHKKIYLLQRFLEPGIAKLRRFLARYFKEEGRGLPLGKLAEGILPGHRGPESGVLRILFP